MKIKLILKDWEGQRGLRLYPAGYLECSKGDFHSGSTFDAILLLDKEQEQDLKSSLKKGYRPIFWLKLPDQPSCPLG